MSYIDQVIFLQCGPPSCTLPKKTFLSPSVWARREYIWKLIWKESLLICFENYLGVPCSHRQSRNRMMNSFIIVNNTPYAIDSLEDKSMLALFKKAFPLTSLGHSFERRGHYLLLCFENYEGIAYSHTGRVDRRWWTLY